MKTPLGTPLRILVHMDVRLRVSREMARGSLRYASTHPDVEVRLFGYGTASERLSAFRQWRPDGLIGGRQISRMPAEARKMGCRAIVFAQTMPPDGCPVDSASVFVDNAGIAQCAAEHFASRNVAHFAYVGEIRRKGERGDKSWSEERDAAFAECAVRTGRTYSSFGAASAAPDSGVRQRRSLAKWVAALPKPCGILCARDMVATKVLDACRDAGVAVPHAALVLGVDNDEFVCPHTPPSLSSVALDYEGGGYLAIATLAKMLKGEWLEGRILRYGAIGVMQRESTSDRGDARLMVSRAREFIEKNATNPAIGVRDVARATFASVRLLELNFKKVTGSTACQAIQDARLRRVCALLAETQTPIGEIAALCGFESDGYLKELFRRRFGRTMSDWRRAPPPR